MHIFISSQLCSAIPSQSLDISPTISRGISYAQKFDTLQLRSKTNFS